MIAKKNSRFDLEQKRTVLFQIGLMAASSLVLAAFTYRSPSLSNVEKERVAHQPITFQMEVVEKPEVERDVVQNQQQDQQQDQTTLNFDENVSENTQTSENTNDAPDPNKLGMDNLGYKIGDKVNIGGDVDVEGEIFEIVDIDAEYIGGYAALQQFITQTVQYPEESLYLGDQGTVYVSFVVETDGSISNIKIARGVTPELDREAKRIVRNFPKWKPAELNYANVRALVRLPITFEIGD